jgi:hypothetical protein
MGFFVFTRGCRQPGGADLRFLRAGAAVLVLALPLGLAGCGGDPPPPTEAYTQLHYEFLPKLRLNVGSITVDDRAHPMGPEDLAAQSPAIPALALEQMAHDRLFAAATAGSANFVVDQASIVRQPNGTLSGTLAVHLEITTPSGASAGYAEAEVDRQHIPGSDPENLQTNLYDLTKQMMDAMNVEFEFQLRKTLSSWLVTGAAVPAAVIAQPLDQTPPPVAAAPPAEPMVPQPDTYQDPMAPPPPPQMSPPPGYLQAPPQPVAPPSY